MDSKPPHMVVPRSSCNFRMSSTRKCSQPIFDEASGLCITHYTITQSASEKNSGIFQLFIPLDVVIDEDEEYVEEDDDDDDDDDDEEEMVEEPKIEPAKQPNSIDECTSVEQVKSLFLKPRFNHSSTVKTICTICQDLNISHLGNIKALAEKVEELKSLPESNSEHNKLRKQIKLMLKLPFDNSATDIIKELSLSNDRQAIYSFLHSAKQQMDEVVYGLHSVKDEILSFIAKQISSSGNGQFTAIALAGDKGIGKTTLALALKNILNRPFKSINLGGKSDSSFLEGHLFTYVGSQPGAIAKALMESTVNNCIIYFDELDKIGSVGDGNSADIYNCLIHLIDQASNKEFNDLYFGSDIAIDLSKVFFIFSFNDASKIDPILLDRIRVFNLKTPTTQEKIEIARKYLIPKFQEAFKGNPYICNIDWSNNEALKYIIDKVADNDSGVRAIKSILEVIYLRINVATYLGAAGNPLVSTYKCPSRLLEQITYRKYTMTVRDVQAIAGEYIESTYGTESTTSHLMMYS